jgi:ABC-type glycerol-3-phosphate transport system substrate-binding protein
VSALLVAAIALAACGGDGPDNSGGSSTSAVDPEAAEEVLKPEP